jgi:hypothetical protein
MPNGSMPAVLRLILGKFVGGSLLENDATRFYCVSALALFLVAIVQGHGRGSSCPESCEAFGRRYVWTCTYLFFNYIFLRRMPAPLS